MNGPTGDTKIELTHAEFQRARREAYIAGAHHDACTFERRDLDALEARARRRYPITKKVPRVLEIGPNFVVTFQEDSGGPHLTFRPSNGGAGWWMRPEDFERVRDLIARPYEEVEE